MNACALLERAQQLLLPPATVAPTPCVASQPSLGRRIAANPRAQLCSTFRKLARRPSISLLDLVSNHPYCLAGAVADSAATVLARGARAHTRGLAVWLPASAPSLRGAHINHGGACCERLVASCRPRAADCAAGPRAAAAASVRTEGLGELRPRASGRPRRARGRARWGGEATYQAQRGASASLLPPHCAAGGVSNAVRECPGVFERRSDRVFVRVRSVPRAARERRGAERRRGVRGRPISGERMRGAGGSRLLARCPPV